MQIQTIFFRSFIFFVSPHFPSISPRSRVFFLLPSSAGPHVRAHLRVSWPPGVSHTNRDMFDLCLFRHQKVKHSLSPLSLLFTLFCYARIFGPLFLMKLFVRRFRRQVNIFNTSTAIEFRSLPASLQAYAPALAPPMVCQLCQLCLTHLVSFEFFIDILGFFLV